jgi:flagellin
MVNSINTNIAAYYAQQNIAVASKAVSLSVARLSSGNRIINASDDIAALAISTSLATSVSSLRTALINAAQGSSLLQVADGALSQISGILQRQKAIAAQAGSGSLSSTERAFLNQEFQALTSEIDRIKDSTNFNNVKLIDGSQAGSVGVFSNTATGTSVDIAGTAAILTFLTAVPADGDTVTIGGVTVTFTTSAPGTSGAVGKVTIGSSITNTASNLAAFLNELKDPRLANLYFENNAATLEVRYTGGDLAGTLSLTVSSNPTTAANLTAANLQINPSTVSTGLDANRTSYVGEVTGSLLVTGSSTAQTAGAPIVLQDIRDNAAFVGQIGEGGIGTFSAIYSGSGAAIFEIQVGNITYTSASTTLVNAGSVVTATFTGRNAFGVAEGGTFALNFNGSALVTLVDLVSQVDADRIAQQLNDSLSGVTFLQNRDITSFVNGEVVQLGGQDVANLVGFTADFQSGNFDSINVSSIKITAPTTGGTDAVFEAIIDGELYRSASGIGNQIGEAKVIALQNVNDPTKVLTFVTGATNIASSSTVTLDLSTQDKADAVAAALENAFGIAEGGAGLSFQVGSASDDTLNVTIGDASTDNLFGGVSLNVLTQEDAATASAAVSAAIATVTSLRANVGALQSRFNFAAANTSVALQNQDAARSELADVDIAAEATSYATQQVKQQAGISVLAQANQQLQSLLKLIG